jgi:DNA polymerase I-like protein with 3'-5' exonuclease and polymerase domains
LEGLVIGSHLQRARDLLALKRKEKSRAVALLPQTLPETNGHSPNGTTLRRKRRNSVERVTTPSSQGPKRLKKRTFTEDDYLKANEELAERHNLIYRNGDVSRVTAWLKTVSGVAVDIETYSTAKTKALRKKEALSFVKGRIRLVQLSSGDKTYFLDAKFLSTWAVAQVLQKLEGKALYCHNGIFDLPRIKRHFGVDLLGEDIRDTMILSRLARAGEWVDAPRRPNRMRPFRHDIRSALLQQGVAQIPNETDHDWHLPLNESRLVYARDDGQYLHELHERLAALVDERDLGKGYELFKSVFPVYLKMQYRGVPFDKEMFEEFNRKLDSKIDEALAKVEEHAPPHPEGGSWSWRNSQPVNEEDATLGAGRNGARRALREAGIPLKNLKKHTRIEYLKNHPGDSPGYPLLEALHQYLGYADLKSDCKDWLAYHYEDGRLYPNVKAFSQETGRSAYSNPALQNIPKDRDPELGISLRDCIRAPEGQKIVEADYAAQELRILAYVAGDEALIATFANPNGKDPHVVVGEQVAGHDLVEGTPEYKIYRKLGKRANYGFSYGAGPARYAQSVYEDTSEQISEKQARAEQKAFQKAWPGVYQWQKDFGARTGEEEDHWYTESFVGRIRYVGQRKDRDGTYTPNYSDRLNGPIQAGGADMLYLALQKLLETREIPAAEIIITTHDEIVLEVPETEAETARLWLYECMREALQELLGPELATEDCVEAEAGPSWGGR